MSTTPTPQPQQPDDPFASLVAQQQTAAQPGDADDPFAHLVQAVQPSTQGQPGFLSRAYEASPLPGMWDAAKGAVNDLVNAPVQGEQTFHEMTDALRAGDFRGAVGKAAKLLVGSETPFSDAAKSVIAGVTKDAHQAGRDIQARNLAAIPVVGTAVNNYKNDVAAGNTSGAIGDVVGGVASVAPMLLGDEATATEASDAASTATDAVKSAAGKAKALVSEDAAAAKAQPVVQGAIRDVAEQQSNVLRAKEGVGPEAPLSVRDAVQNVGDAIKARSKAAFSQLDEASGGRWQRFDDALSNLRDKMSETAGVDDEAFEKYSQRAQDVEASQNDLINQLVSDGKIDPDAAEGAKADYKQANALYDVSQQIRNASSGLRPELGEGTPEAVDPAKLAPRLNKLYDSGRLQQALGSDGAAQLVKQVDEALQTKTSAIKTAKLVKTIGKAAGAAIGLGALGHVAAGVLSGGNH
jgi:hypothetical protein